MRIRLHEVGHRFSDTWLFRDRSETFESGSLHALSGPSGCGKSTLLAIIAGMLKPASGSIEIEDIGGDSAFWVFQSAHGVAQRTVVDHVVLPLLAKGQTRHRAHSAAEEILAQFDLAHAAGQPFKELSGGQAQRLMLARALARDPACLLVDEPTAQLDRHSAIAVAQTLSALRSVGRIVIVASHDGAVLDQCDQVIRMGDW